MGKLIDLTGTIIGDIEILGDDVERNKIEYQRFLNGEIKKKHNFVKCKCLRCDSEFSRSRDGLKQNKKVCTKCSGKEFSKSKTKNHNDIIGNKYGKITVLSIKERIKKKTYYNCVCECGSDIVIKRDYLIYKDLQSCPKCNSINIKRPDLIKYLKYKEDAEKYTIGSSKKIYSVCPNCNNEKQITVSQLVLNGLSCPICGDSTSYGEKFIMSMLNDMNINYKYQKIFRWANNKKYDFYLYDYNAIIEVNGAQHYEHGFETIFGGATLEEQQLNDLYKKEIALKNGISCYIELDCRKSNIEWIKESILKTDLIKFINFEEIDFDKFNYFAKYNNVLNDACKLYNEGMLVYEIADNLHIYRTTVSNKLVLGNKIGLCNFKKNKKTMCVCDRYVFDSIRSCTKYFGLKNNTQISMYLSNKKPMPQKYLSRGLRYYNPDTDKDLPIYVDTSLEV